MPVYHQHIPSSGSNPFLGYNVATRREQKGRLVQCYFEFQQPPWHSRLQGEFSFSTPLHSGKRFP